MKKLVLGILFLSFFISNRGQATTTYSWESVIGGTCSAVSTGTDHMLCLDSVSASLYKCTTSLGTCVLGVNGNGWTGNGTTTAGTILSTTLISTVGTVPGMIASTTLGALETTANGTSLDDLNDSGSGPYTGIYEMSQGTGGSPITTAGPILKISRTDGYASITPCNGFSGNSECNASIAVYALGTSTDYMQVAAGFFNAETSTTEGGGADAVGIFAQGLATGTGANTRGTGAYLSGTRNATTASTNGAEIRATNYTSSNCTYSSTTTNAGGCDGVIISLGGNGSNATTLSAALHVINISTGAGTSFYHTGLTINSGTLDATGFGIDDESGQPEIFLNLAAPSGHSYFVCVNNVGKLTSQTTACAG